MPTCLLHFVEEWQKARRVIYLSQMDFDAKFELAHTLHYSRAVDMDGHLASQFGIANWSADPAEAQGIKNWLEDIGIRPYDKTYEDEVETNDGGAGEDAEEDDDSEHTLKRDGSSRKTLNTSRKSLSGSRKTLSGRTRARLSAQRTGAISTALKDLVRQKTNFQARGSISTFVDAAKAAIAEADSNRHRLKETNPSILFLNSSSPLSSFTQEVTKEEFVVTLRKNLMAERLFTEGVGANKRNDEHPMASVHEAEDLFESLLTLQSACALHSGTNLMMGRTMDETIHRFHVLRSFRQLIERDQATITSFILSYFIVPKVNELETELIRHFFKSGVEAKCKVEDVMHAMDANNDGTVTMDEFSRQLSLVAPPRQSLLEMVSQLELKHGFGRCGLTNAHMTRLDFFEHMACVEKLAPPPEDVARIFRAASAKESAKATKEMHTDSVCNMFKAPPLEVTWGAEPHGVRSMYDALACRALVMERHKHKDAMMPIEAFLDGQPMEERLGYNFRRLWERYGVTLISGVTNRVADEYYKGCLARYTQSAYSCMTKRRSNNARTDKEAIYRCMFPSIGDVLATASTQLLAGQVCTVRYRLCGPGSFWGQQHTVLKDERETLAWPVQKKSLGDTPFIGLVPRGLTWCAAGGGGFYIGSQAFTSVDPNLRADLPQGIESGDTALTGVVMISMPAVSRTHRAAGSQNGKAQAKREFELRLFSATKHRITGCIGEPVPIVVHTKMPPPPAESLQLRVEGRSCTLRWTALELDMAEADDLDDSPERILLLIRSEKKEDLVVLDPSETEYEMHNLGVDTEYEFRLRYENAAGPGRDVTAHCRINAVCPAPQLLTVFSYGTIQMELRWQKPLKLGNESTSDRYQIKTERIQKYIATLRVVEDEEPHEEVVENSPIDGVKEGDSEEKGDQTPAAEVQPNLSRRQSRRRSSNLKPPVAAARPLVWTAESLREDKSTGLLMATLKDLRSDTKYCFSGLCAVNSIGEGAQCAELVFRTIPLMPRIDSIRVRKGQVLLSLSESGGLYVNSYEVSVLKEGKPEKQAAVWPLKAEQVLHLQNDDGDEEHPILPLRFSYMPSADALEKHQLRLRACNEGGWSDWSPWFLTSSIARQQGADQAEAALVAAIRTPNIESLEQVLRDIKGIEFQDYRYVNQATELLQRLKEVRNALAEATKARNPEQIRAALAAAVEAQLPGLSKAENLLRKLEKIVQNLETAKGIAPLRVAIRAGETAKLPASILAVAKDRLQKREEAQKGLEDAIEMARVPELVKALEQAKDMDLPSEEAAQEKKMLLESTQTALEKAMSTKVIPDLSAALTLATKSGLREKELIEKARSQLQKLMGIRESVQKELDRQTAYKHPGQLKKTIMSARLAQVNLQRILNADTIRKKADQLLKEMGEAVGLQQREETLAAAAAYAMPQELLKPFEDQLDSLQKLHDALEFGDPEVLRTCLHRCDETKLKLQELLHARVVYRDWGAAFQRVEVEASVLRRRELLEEALAAARKIGINEQRLEYGIQVLQELKNRQSAEAELARCIEARKLEPLSKAIKTACNAYAYDYKLLLKAHELAEVLKKKRLDLHAATESAELHSVHKTLEYVASEPALPEDELVNAEILLDDLREVELEALTQALKKAEKEQDFRAGVALLDRAERAEASGVEVDTIDAERVETWCKAAEAAQREQIENDIMRNRISGIVPKPPDVVPEVTQSTFLPKEAVCGSLEVAFDAAGSYVATLPREVVEATLVVNISSSEEQMKATHTVHALLDALRRMIGPADDVKALADMPQLVEGELGRRHRRCSIGKLFGRIELPIVFYIREAHRSLDVADAIVRRSRLANDLWAPEPQKIERAEYTIAGLASSVSESVTKSMFSNLLRQPGEAASKQLVDFVSFVEARVFRSLTVELSWTYPKGIFDSITCSCIVFDKDNMLEIIDIRGAHGQKYGAPPPFQNPGKTSRKDKLGRDTEKTLIQRSVRYMGDVTDSAARKGKQMMEVRLDSLPSNVTDLVFVSSPSNSRDLSKFADLESTVLDTEAIEVLAHHDCWNPGDLDKEAAIMTCIYRLEDGLWRVNNIGTLCSGGHRDYRPVLLKLLNMGYPRNPAMQNFVQPVLSRIQKELSLPEPVKSCKVEMNAKNGLHLRYGIEMVEDSPDHSLLLQQIANGRFTKAIVKTLKASGGRKLTEKHVNVLQPRVRSLRHMVFELSWEFPAKKEGENAGDLNFQGNHFLDAACVVFEGQALRELVDYRGAHGVRWVTNGVLDYRGHWVGQIPVGDATGGSILWTGHSLDNLTRSGKATMEVLFDKLPKGVTEFYFVLSSPTLPIGQFGNVKLVARSVDEEGLHVHVSPEISTGSSKEATAIIMYRCSRSKSDPTSWSLETLGAPCPGRATDYRQALECLWAVQSDLTDRRVQWPCRGVGGSGARIRPHSARPELRLPPIDDANAGGQTTPRAKSASAKKRRLPTIMQQLQPLPEIAAASVPAPESTKDPVGEAEQPSNALPNPSASAPSMPSLVSTPLGAGVGPLTEDSEPGSPRSFAASIFDKLAGSEPSPETQMTPKPSESFAIDLNLASQGDPSSPLPVSSPSSPSQSSMGPIPFTPQGRRGRRTSRMI